MPNEFQRLTVEAASANEVLVMPHFGDIIDENGEVMIASDEEGDWQMWNDIPYKRNIFDIYGNKNLLKRRDATCKLIYSSLGTMSNRVIETTALYLAAENCQRELYQGAFRDWESRSDVFTEKALELISLAVGTDLFSNKWFGFTGRPANAEYSLNKFNGIWHWIAVDVTAGTIPTAQTVDLGDAATFTDQEAFEGIRAMISAQPVIMKALPKGMKTIHIDQDWFDKISRYLISIGDGSAIDKASALETIRVEGYLVKPKTWDHVIYTIMGAVAHLGVITLNGNFIFGTDAKYGSGPNSDGPALKVWYSDDDDVTRWAYHVKAGTMLGTPGYAVVATTTGVLAQL